MTAGAVHAASAVFVSLHKTIFMKILLRSTLFFSSALVVVAAAAAPDLTLRSKQPAPDTPEGWEREALPIGNGRIGAMIFGQLRASASSSTTSRYGPATTR